MPTKPIRNALRDTTHSHTAPFLEKTIYNMSGLINCPACNREVSDIAEKCPHCGQPIKPKKSSGCLFAFGVVFLIAGIFIWWPALIIGILIFIWAAVDKE